MFTCEHNESVHNQSLVVHEAMRPVHSLWAELHGLQVRVLGSR